jgi:hypothetical protein
MSNIPPFDRLTQPQRVALISIMTGDSPDRTAYLARVTERTIRRWRGQPVFQAALADARRDFFSACRSHLNTSLAVAFDALVDSASSIADRSVRLKAALSILDRISHTEMSAKPLPEGPQPIEISRLGEKSAGPNRTSADIRGPEGTFMAVERTLSDDNGPERLSIPTS